MKPKYFLILFTLGLVLTLALLWGFPSQSTLAEIVQSVIEQSPNTPTAELEVCSSGCDYSSIQAAVDAASDGDIF